MPELPEVETTRQGIEPFLVGQEIVAIEVRDQRLRWPVPRLVQQACGHRVLAVRRRAKYIIIDVADGALLLHLGMSGSMRALAEQAPPGKHDHFDIVTERAILRYCDPRRFGSFTWVDRPAEAHPLLASLGPEPLSAAFSGDYLYAKSRGRKAAVKNFVMDGRIVVGVGNIYASESLYMAGIHPSRPAGRISRERYAGLAEAIQDVLGRAIRRGGTTLRDFSGTGGTPGYFAQELLVYDREGGPCLQCGKAVRRRVIGQRSSFFCPACQR
jgi:formamidopyrimidine-DNA glycosylase